jgi:hypothetical protein
LRARIAKLLHTDQFLSQHQNENTGKSMLSRQVLNLTRDAEKLLTAAQVVLSKARQAIR